ncbi:hypothetical protein SNEBB_011326 [Seison nebaliae]|nr:hypothetical protein SNEBB_011326 [Seison nebaliae]
MLVNLSGDYKKYAAIFGAFLLHLTIGVNHSFGNIAPYIVSYIRFGENGTTKYVDFNQTEVVDERHLNKYYLFGGDYSQIVWIYGTMFGLQGLCSFIGGFYAPKLSTRTLTLIGCSIADLGIILTGWTLTSRSFGPIIITFGIMFGLGSGIVYIPPIQCAMNWMPDKRGLATGIVLSGQGFAVFFFSLIQSKFVNPNNLPPTKVRDRTAIEAFFTQKELLVRVPNMFYLLGGIFIGIQIFAISWLQDPEPEDEASPLDVHKIIRNEKSIDSIENTEISENSVSSDHTTTEPSYQNRELSTVPEKFTDPIDNDLNRTSTHVEIFNRLRESLSDPAFLILYVTMFCIQTSVVLLDSLYKSYGQTFIQDDHFLSYVGAFAYIAHGFGRMFGGYAFDKFDYKLSMGVSCAATGVLTATMILTPYGHKAMFFIWIVLLYNFWAWCFSIVPSATAAYFGEKNFGPNYGLIFSSISISSIFGATLSHILLDYVGWNGIFLVAAVFDLICLILVFMILCRSIFNYLTMAIHTLGHITNHNIEQLRLLNSIIFPVKYPQTFYDKVTTIYNKYSKFALYNDIIVGAICARIEHRDNETSMYIMTIGVLPAYRKMNIGSELMDEIEKCAKADKSIRRIYLHVQIDNVPALEFYEKRGYILVEKVENYYDLSNMPHAYLLEKMLEEEEEEKKEDEVENSST